MPIIGKYMREQPMQYIKNKKVLADWLRPFCLFQSLTINFLAIFPFSLSVLIHNIH
jgi:hypothetical protein